MSQTTRLKVVQCGWSKQRHGRCNKKPILEMESLLGNWTPICKYHLELKKRNLDNNPWGGLFEIKTRELTNKD